MTNARPMRSLAALMTFEAATLAIVATLHVTGASGDGPKPFAPSGAGIAEAIICVVLLLGAAALFRDPVRGRQAALGAVAFAIFGFIIGLTFTLRGGPAVDVATTSRCCPC